MFRLRCGLLLLLLCGLLLGCGPRTQTGGKARGIVRYHGQPLQGGNLIFHSDKGSYHATIAQDGTGYYEVVDLPPGDLDVTVETEFLNPGTGGGAAAAQMAKKGEKVDKEYAAGMAKMKGSAAPAPVNKEELAKRYTKIPAKYSKRGTSKLNVTVASGWNDKDFDLTD
jgi:hypothetical protein